MYLYNKVQEIMSTTTKKRAFSPKYIYQKGIWYKSIGYNPQNPSSKNPSPKFQEPRFTLRAILGFGVWNLRFWAIPYTSIPFLFRLCEIKCENLSRFQYSVYKKNLTKFCKAL